MKKLLSVALALTCAFGMGLAGCSSSGGSGGGTTTPEEGLKIVIVSSPSGVDDGSFNQDNYNGILAFIEANPSATVKDVREETVDNSVTAVENVVADYDVVVTPGFQFSGITDIAEANAEKYFILVDAFPADAEGATVEVDNIYAMQFAEQESGFFAGIAAALQTKTGFVASVHGIAYPSNVNYQWGFESGVAYANKNLGTNAQIVSLASFAGKDAIDDSNVGGNYIGTFDDPAKGKEVGEALLAQNVDIIFVAAGGSGNGVFAAVKEFEGEAYVIGCDVDQFDDGVNGDKNIVLTSALKIMAPNVQKQLQNIEDGTFIGGNFTLDATTDSTGYVSADGRHQLTDETLAALEDAYAAVKAGDIVPASRFNGHTPMDFPGL